jgi:hypothetical protein
MCQSGYTLSALARPRSALPSSTAYGASARESLVPQCRISNGRFGTWLKSYWVTCFRRVVEAYFCRTSRASAARVSSLWSRNLRQSRVFGLTVLRFSSKRQQLIVAAGVPSFWSNCQQNFVAAGWSDSSILVSLPRAVRNAVKRIACGVSNVLLEPHSDFDGQVCRPFI